MSINKDIILLDSDSLVTRVKNEVNDLILYFSCGKDSIAMWLWLRGKGFNILPVYLYTVPGLRSDQENLTYYENYFGQHIMRFPHPLMYEMLNGMYFQPPENAAKITAWRLPKFNFADIDKVIDEGYLNGRPFYAAMGMRMADNLDRRMMMYQNGALGQKARRYYYAIWDWNVARVGEIVSKNNCKIPKAYKFIGRTVAAIDYLYMRPFREIYPDDYQKILDWFPMLEAEFFRYERLSG